MAKSKKIVAKGNQIGIILHEGDDDFISLTDMLKAKDGDFFISDWLRNRNTVEFLGIWEKIHNPNFNYGEFAVIKHMLIKTLLLNLVCGLVLNLKFILSKSFND